MTEPFQPNVAPAIEAPTDEPPLPFAYEQGGSGAETSVAPEFAPVVPAPNAAQPEVDDLSTADESGSRTGDDILLELKDSIAHLSSVVEKHHQRATHRELVIDNLHEELEKFRTGERRTTVRPVLLAVARLRDDLLRQGRDLPADFDAARAQKLLQSFADSIEITLDDFGISVYTPGVGEAFEPRRHKAVSSTPTGDATLVRTVEGVRRDGYLDREAGITISQAEVALYVAASVQPPVTAEAPTAEPAEPTDAPMVPAPDETPTVDATSSDDPSTAAPVE